MTRSEKIKRLLALRNMTTGQLTRTAGISRATMSRIMKDDHRLADDTLEKIAAVLDVSVVYLRGGYVLPPHLTEDDVLFLADMRNVPYLKLVREIARIGVSVKGLGKLTVILSTSS